MLNLIYGKQKHIKRYKKKRMLHTPPTYLIIKHYNSKLLFIFLNFINKIRFIVVQTLVHVNISHLNLNLPLKHCLISVYLWNIHGIGSPQTIVCNYDIYDICYLGYYFFKGREMTGQAHHNDKYVPCWWKDAVNKSWFYITSHSFQLVNSCVSNKAIDVHGRKTLNHKNPWLISLGDMAERVKEIWTMDCFHYCNVTLYDNHKGETLYYSKTITPQKLHLNDVFWKHHLKVKWVLSITIMFKSTMRVMFFLAGESQQCLSHHIKFNF